MAHFENYQKRSDGVGAWIWEHQALTRARFVAGDPAIGRRFDALREEVLRMPRDLAALKEAVLEMRERMHEGHRNPTKLFDVKHDAGGMVDVEFIVQTLVLGYSHDHPQLVNNFGNILLLEMAVDAGLIPAELTAKVVKAYRRYRALQHEIRLNAGEARAVRVDPALERLHHGGGQDAHRYEEGNAQLRRETCHRRSGTARSCSTPSHSTQTPSSLPTSTAT